MKSVQFSIAIVLCCVIVNSYSISIRLPNGRVREDTLGQEEIGPIDNYTCLDDGLFSHEECDLFISCWDKRAVLWRCTDEMLYDLRYKGKRRRCEYAENVDCGDRRRPPDSGTRTPPTPSTSSTPSTTPDPDLTTTPKPNGTFDCPDNGVFPHSERCEYYWNCWDGTASLEHCPLNYLFDLVYDGCNFPELTDCGDRKRPDPLPTTTDGAITDPTTPAQGSSTSEGTTKQPENFQCPRPEGVFPDPDDCSSFYTCITNIPIRNSCPDGLHFNSMTEECDWPEDAGCQLSHFM